jgi:hypothetical protein
VLLEGKAKHWPEGTSDDEAKVLGAGGYWFQPGNQAHTDT